MFRSFLVITLTLCLILLTGCEGGRDDITSLSLYNINIIDDKESQAGGYSKLYVTLKDPTLNVEIFPNARAAMESKGWDNVWVNSVLNLHNNKKVIPQIVGFETQEDRDTFIQLLTTQSAEGVAWKYESHEYISEFMLEYSGIANVYVAEFSPIIPDIDNLTPAQKKLLDKIPPILIDSIPKAFTYQAVDPEEIMKNGIILTFDENVTGDIKLLYISDFLDYDLGWELVNKGNKLVLMQGSGDALGFDASFTVSGTVQDENGNSTEIWYSFRTKRGDITPPEIISSSPQDGDEYIDPVKLFKDGIYVKFSEPIEGELQLQTEGGEDIGWTSTTEGDTIKLTSAAGAELEYETFYTIIGVVQDSAGWETIIEIWFVTIALE